MHSKTVIQSQFEEFAARHNDERARVDRIQNDMWEISKDIGHIKDQIGELFYEKRQADHDEKSYYQDEIESLLDERRRLYERQDELRLDLQEAKKDLKQVSAKGRQLSKELQKEITKQGRNARKISGAIQGSFSDQLGGIKETIRDTHKFAQRVINSINEKLGGATFEDDIQFEDLQQEDTPKNPDGLYLTEPPINDVYLTNNEERAIPLQAYTVGDTLETLGEGVFDAIEQGAFATTDAAIKIGNTAVAFTKAILKAGGHETVLDLGGPGQPDVLSLDQEGTLWVTESKGTMKNSDLSSSGLRRKLKEESGEEISLMENSVQWVARKFQETLKAIDASLDSTADPIERAKLAKLKDAYVASARSNFSSKSMKTQIVQVGFSHGNDLKPPYAQESNFFDEWIEETNPERIIQVDVVPGDKTMAGEVDNTGGELP